MADYASREQMLAAFGPFAIAFEPIGKAKRPYLTLLTLYYPEEALVVVDALRLATGADAAEGYLLTLLKDVNWRPHLVAAAAAWWLRSDSVICQAWRALDAGSWVSPQLAAVLSLIDLSFFSRACDRLAAECPLSDDPEYAVSTAIEKHSYQGPGGAHDRSSKSAAALLALLQQLYPDNQMVNELSQSPTIQELIDSDIDEAGVIATEWRSDLEELVRNLPEH